MVGVNSKRILDILVILTAGLLAIQCLMLLSRIVTTRSTEIGTVAASTISFLVLQIVALAAVLAMCSMLRLNKDEWAVRITNNKLVRHLPLFVGGLLAVEGLVALNLSNTIVQGLAPSMIMLVGIQLSCLGILALASYVVSQESAYLRWNIPTYAPLLMVLYLLPAAFLID